MKKPTLSAIARVIGRASGLLRIKDQDEKLSVENAATMTLAEKLPGHTLLWCPMADEKDSLPSEPPGRLDERFCEIMDAAPVMI